MTTRKIPEAGDRSETVVRRSDAKIIDLDAERRRRADLQPDTGTNSDAEELGSDGGAQNEPI